MRLEERSRELAEENLKKEITNALKMLEVSVSEVHRNNGCQCLPVWRSFSRICSTS